MDVAAARTARPHGGWLRRPLSGRLRLQNVDAEVFLGLLDVIVHCATRLLGVSGSDGLQDAGVVLDRVRRWTPVRFYERVGVLPEHHPAYRDYAPDTVERIQLTRELQAIGFTLGNCRRRARRARRRRSDL